MGELQIQQNSHSRRVPVWRKILTLGLLSIIMFVWITGWILTQIGDQRESTEISQKSLRTHPGFETYVKESEVPDEDSRIVNEPQIVA
jgi:hypothetical protein